MLHTQRVEDSRIQGLTWYAGARIRGREVWGHGGSDPGINTDIRLVPEERVAAIVFINTWGENPSQITRHLLEEAPNFWVAFVAARDQITDAMNVPVSGR